MDVVPCCSRETEVADSLCPSKCVRQLATLSTTHSNDVVWATSCHVSGQMGPPGLGRGDACGHKQRRWLGESERTYNVSISSLYASTYFTVLSGRPRAGSAIERSMTSKRGELAMLM